MVGLGECLQAPDTPMRSSGGRLCQGCHRGCHDYHWCYQHHRCDHQVVLCWEYSLLFGPQYYEHLENMILMDPSLLSLGLSPRLLLSAQNTLYFHYSNGDTGNTQHENFRGWGCLPCLSQRLPLYLSVISKKKTIPPTCGSLKKKQHIYYLTTSHFQNQSMVFLGLLDKGLSKV